MTIHSSAAQRVRDLPASDAARDVGDWLLAEMPSSVQRVRVYPGPGSGLAFEFENGSWDLTVEVSCEGMMLFFGVAIDGPGEIEPYPFDPRSDALVVRISRLAAANDR
jgi:hypothetical protein